MRLAFQAINEKKKKNYKNENAPVMTEYDYMIVIFTLKKRLFFFFSFEFVCGRLFKRDFKFNRNNLCEVLTTARLRN